MLDDLATKHITRGVTKTSDLARAVRNDLDAKASKGSIEAKVALDQALLAGLQTSVKKILKRAKSRITVKSGNVVEIPARWGVQTTNEKGRVVFQQMLWLEMDRETFDALLDRERRRRKSQSTRVAALEAVERVWNDHPQARTAAEAFEIEGIDPSTLVIYDDEARA